MKFVGYTQKLPICSGDRVTIKKGTMVRSNGETKPAGRTYTVQVHHVLNGYTPDAAEIAYQDRHGKSAFSFNPKAVWAGSGGYWCEVDMNDIPEAQGTDEFVNLGDVIRKQLNQQCQYGSRYADESDKDFVATGLRINGTRADYHSMTIHKDDVDEFVRRVQAHRSNA